MYCPRCGANNFETAVACQQCGQVLGGTSPPTMQYRAMLPEPVPSHLAPAILVTLFCCMPFGIPAIVFAAQSMGRHSAGDYAGARIAADKAKTWCWVSFGLGLAAGVVWFLAAVASASL
jgi:hypothetical protein